MQNQPTSKTRDCSQCRGRRPGAEKLPDRELLASRTRTVLVIGPLWDHNLLLLCHSLGKRKKGRKAHTSKAKVNRKNKHKEKVGALLRYRKTSFPFAITTITQQLRLIVPQAKLDVFAEGLPSHFLNTSVYVLNTYIQKKCFPFIFWDFVLCFFQEDPRFREPRNHDHDHETRRG